MSFQCVHRRHKLVVGGGAEATDADISYVRLDHIEGVERLHRDLVSDDVEKQRAGDAAAHDSEFHVCALGATQTLHDLFLRHLYACYRRVVDADDAVTGHDAHLLRRAFRHGLYDQQRVGLDVELHADTLERAVERL